jgi:AraC-like DNA-binding protein
MPWAPGYHDYGASRALPYNRAVLVRSQLVPLAVRHLGEKGAEVRALLADARPSEAGVSLELETLHALLEACERASGDPWLGVHLAAERPVGSHGIVEFFWRSAATVREGLATLAAHSRLLNEVARLELVEAGPRASFLQRVAHPLGMGRHANEFFAAMLVREIRLLVSPDFRPAGARFAHPRPGRDLRPLRDALGTGELRWGDAGTGLDFDARWLDVPLATADATLSSTLRAHTSTWMPWVTRDPDEALEDRLRALLHGSVGRPPSVAAAARRLGVSARTLQRRLLERGETFHSVADGVLAEHACRVVASGSLSVKEAGRRLGYASTASFVRAFRRWTGQTPSAWRDRRTERRDR